MARYAALQDHLSSLGERTTWRATFSEIEAILDFKLPRSARSYQAWWTNNRQGSRHNRAWLDAGWRTTEPDLSGERVIFVRDGSTAAGRNSRVQTRSTTKLNSEASSPQLWNKTRELRCSIEMTWTPIGRVLLGNDDKLTFPRASTTPALYCFKIRNRGKQTQYVGETDNLQRRFGNYRNPGPSQATSLRINAALKRFLQEQAEIAVETISEAWITWGAERKQPDFARKAVRLLYESTTICDEGAIEIESLNK